MGKRKECLRFVEITAVGYTPMVQIVQVCVIQKVNIVVKCIVI